MDVGVRELRERLSELLDRAEAGGFIRVTHRGRPKALIVPPTAESWVGAVWEKIATDAHVERGIREGKIRRRLIDEPPDIPERGFKGEMPTIEALREDRDEE